jgi:hypothetical protein
MASIVAADIPGSVFHPSRGRFVHIEHIESDDRCYRETEASELDADLLFCAVRRAGVDAARG